MGGPRVGSVPDKQRAVDDLEQHETGTGVMWNHLAFVLMSIAAYLFLHPAADEAKRIIEEAVGGTESVERYYRDTDFSKQKPATNQYNAAVEFEKDRTKLGKENATILMLTRNFELPGVLSSMRSLEDRFNKDYRYTWTFLNDELFTEQFKRETTAMASGATEYGLIDPQDWGIPGHINQTKMEECIANMTANKVIYAHSTSYRNMCKFNSGYFFRQPLTLKYDYYFRVEPDVEYMCDFQYDPFELMRTQNKNYGFVLTFYEYIETIPTLWDTVEGFMDEYPQYIHPNSAVDFITSFDVIGSVFRQPDSRGYNLCHFWSNFEIGNLNFFRSEAYLKFYEYLEQAGGFYYERWGDAPVHSIAVSLLMDKEQVHHFDDIGYFHNPFMTCPSSENVRVKKRCVCRPGAEVIDNTPYSCLPRWWKYGSGRRFLSE